MQSQPPTSWMDAWRNVLFTHARVIRALERELREEHDLPLTWFDVMNRLDAAPGRRMRMHDLSEAVLFTRSGLTRLVDRIERAGYLRRERSSADRRGVYAALTPEGERKLEGVWPGHTEDIRRHFAQYLDDEDVRALNSALAKVLAAYEVRVG